jgi:hypothetical protein
MPIADYVTKVQDNFDSYHFIVTLLFYIAALVLICYSC